MRTNRGSAAPFFPIEVPVGTCAVSLDQRQVAAFLLVSGLASSLGGQTYVDGGRPGSASTTFGLSVTTVSH